MGQELGSGAVVAEDRSHSATSGETAIASAFRGLVDFFFNLSSIALVIASAVLTGGVIAAHVLQRGIEWQDEMEVFLVAGAVFLSAAAVQARRGHIGIEVLDSFMPESARAWRTLLTDALSLVFVAFVAWKSGALLSEAWSEGHVSQSTWAPPLWIPYAIMTLGLALLACELALQVGEKSVFALLAAIAAVAALLLWQRPVTPLFSGFTPAAIGVAYCAATLIAMLSGMPIAFALGTVATAFMILFMPRASVETIAQNVYEELANVILLAIPLFILKGAAIGRSAAGRDLYTALHAWLHRIPGGLGIANTLACGLFAAMAGSSPATCSAIGSAGIPEMRKRGYSPGLASGIIAAGGTLGILLPPSVTMLLYAVAAEVSLGKLFLAGIGPGLLLIVLFAAYAAFRYSQERKEARSIVARGGKPTAILEVERYTLREKLAMLAWVTPFVTILAGVMIVLYAGLATPSETAGVGAILALIVIGVMYGVWRPYRLMPILTGHDARKLDAAPHRRVFAALRLCDELSAHLAKRGRLADLARPLEMGSALRRPVAYRSARLLSPAGLNHPDDGAGHSAADQGGGLRPYLVRRRHDHRHGDGPHPPARRPEPLCDQEHCARHLSLRGHVGDAAVRDPDGGCDCADLPASGHRDATAGLDRLKRRALKRTRASVCLSACTLDLTSFPDWRPVCVYVTDFL